jgi:Flp pilus assembly protein CpaB
MNRSRTLILLGIVLLLGAVAVLVLLPQQQQNNAQVLPTPVPEIPTTQIVVAAQDIPRGTIIGDDALTLGKWPDDSLPPSDLTILKPEEVLGKRARTDILRGQPVLQSMITADLQQLAAIGAEASLFIPPGKRAVSFPIDQMSSVGYAVGSGDRVDMLITFSVIDVNQEGQYPIVPFNRDLVDELIAAGIPSDAAATQVLADIKNAKIEPRLVSQLTLQNIEILHVGEWPVHGLYQRPTPTLSPEQQAAQPPPAPAGTPTATPPRPGMLILMVDPQQSLILEWLKESGVLIRLALRGAADSAPVSTDAVSYQYILTNFNITIPPKVNTIIDKATKSLPTGQ